MFYEIIYTSGCCLNNGKAYSHGGVGVFFDDNDYRNIGLPLGGEVHTSNRADLQAVIYAIQLGKHGYNLLIKTKSKYVYLAMTRWIDTWKENGWYTVYGERVRNLDLFLEICEQIENHSGKILFELAKGHHSAYGDEQADELARKGARCPYCQ